jgi:hypothetical protein
MRELILKRIAELRRSDSGLNAYRQFGKNGQYYLWSQERFAALTDEELIRHFEIICGMGYRQYG